MQSIEEKEIILPGTKVLKDMMMKRVGIVRSKELLEAQKNWLLQLHLHDVRKLDNYRIQSISNYFMYVVASLITEAALRRTESRGGHFRSDFPFEDDENWRRKMIVQRGKEGVAIHHQHVETAHIT
ncbi:hypothetical protein [Oceanobacillus damuensis]|uniref:hypothetical protein n=1 Tax=Oceanobacillus damuensis TaxID=937928 RepID=UPI00082FF7EB|nr:hypothetical protein [Oceanobacillus damuensis]